jgi:hypothetical protein
VVPVVSVQQYYCSEKLFNSPSPPSSCTVSQTTSRQQHRHVAKKRQAQRAWPHILSARRRETASSCSSGRSRSKTLAEDGWFMSEPRYRINRGWGGRLSLARSAQGRRGGLHAGPARPSQRANSRCALSRCLSLIFFNELTYEVGTKLGNMNVAQIVISTDPHES